MGQFLKINWNISVKTACSRRYYLVTIISRS